MSSWPDENSMAYVHLIKDDLLGTLLSAELPVDEKLRIMEIEFSILADDRMREDMSTMCNLSQGILARGEARIILSMYKNGYIIEQIANASDKTIKEIKEIIEKKEHALA